MDIRLKFTQMLFVLPLLFFCIIAVDNLISIIICHLSGSWCIENTSNLFGNYFKFFFVWQISLTLTNLKKYIELAAA